MSGVVDEPGGGAVWAPYGLSNNPFFTGPLVSRPGIDRGIHLFRGPDRDDDADRLLQRIRNSDNSVRLIEGPVGIGKTTLANRVKYKVGAAASVAVYPDSIQIHPSETTPEKMAAEMLYGVLVAVRSHPDLETEAEEEVQDEAGGRVVDSLVRAKDRSVGLSKILEATWTRTTILREAGQRPFGDWLDALRNVRDIASSHGVDRILLHVNNLDKATRTDADRVGDLFGQARDLLQIPGYHFVLCSGAAFRQKALANRPGVTDILGAPLRPSPLSPDDVEAIIQARYEDLEIPSRSFEAPIEPEEVARLFRLFDGDLRTVFEALGQTFMEEVGPRTDPAPLDADDVVSIQRPIFEDLLSTLPEPQFRVLRGVVELAEGDDEVRQNELVDHLDDLSQGYVSQLADELVDARWLTKRRPHQRRTLYAPAGRAKVLEERIQEIE